MLVWRFLNLFSAKNSKLCHIYLSIAVNLLGWLLAASPAFAETRACKQADLYGINWTVDGCSCAADTLSNPKTGAFAEDTIAFSRGWIDARDLICDPKTGKWKAKPNPKFAKCSGCKEGYGTNGICGPATLKASATAPTSGLCTCGNPTKVKRVGSWHWQCKTSNETPPINCFAPALHKKAGS